MRRLIDDQVQAWRAGYSRGERPSDLADPDGVARRAHRNLAGYGPLGSLLADDDVWEKVINPHHSRASACRPSIGLVLSD